MPLKIYVPFLNIGSVPSAKQMAELFGTKRPAITKHLNNIYKCGELKEESTCSILEHMGNDGKQLYTTRYYNLDAIISVGFRVNTKRGIEFRQWANQVLKDYLLKGYVVNQRISVLEHQVAVDVSATIYTRQLSNQQQLDITRHNQQYPPITVNLCQRNHDRFLLFYFLVHSESEIVEEDIVNTRRHRPDFVYDHRRNHIFVF